MVRRWRAKVRTRIVGNEMHDADDDLRTAASQYRTRMPVEAMFLVAIWCETSSGALSSTRYSLRF